MVKHKHSGHPSYLSLPLQRGETRETRNDRQHIRQLLLRSIKFHSNTFGLVAPRIPNLDISIV